MKYLVISPVKDEERYVEHTLRSMAQQTVKPVCWIIVDDGSSDRTPELLRHWQSQHDFIRIVTNSNRQGRQTGWAEVRAFKVGYEQASGFDYDLIVKLDCDLSFEPDYFEKLLEKFAADPRLGIGSGVYLETADGSAWTEVLMPPYHAAGASKVLRRKCFEEINGFIVARGWDTVDEIRAMTRGWRTGHFRDLQMKHWKPEGSGMGTWHTNLMHGEIFYLTGGSFLFFLLKLFHRITRRPFVVGGVALLYGYVRTILARKPRLVRADEIRCYRALLYDRMRSKFKGMLRLAL